MKNQGVHLYLLSGLGADERIFRKLDLEPYPHTFIKWIEPLKKESLEAYALRLSAQIKHENPVLLGISFGGMIATEIRRQRPDSHTILIASAKNKHELPLYYQWAGVLKINKLIPQEFLLKSGKLADWFFGTTATQHKQVLKNILADTNPAFFSWAIEAILQWELDKHPEGIVHIHGTADRLIPIRNIDKPLAIASGGHLLPLTHAADINRILQETLNKLS